MRFTRRHPALLAVAALCLLSWPSDASAAPLMQSESELIQQNQRLEQRVRELEAALAAAIKRIGELEQEIQRAKEPAPDRVPLPTDATDPGAPTAPADPNAPGAAPADPNAQPPATDRPPSSPFDNSATIFDAIRARFAADFAGRPAPREGESDERLTRLWTVEIERWANMVNRELRRPIIWNVRILTAESAGRSWRLEVICVDPTTRADVGRPFFVHLQQPQSASLESSQRLGTADGDFTLRGVYVPQIAINPTRFDVGPFDLPPFIGTFLEYGFRLTVTSFVHTERRGARRSAPTAVPPQQPVTPGTPGVPTPPPAIPAAPADPAAPTR